jgi:GNAT superfamily N-acetyltransferase
LYPVFNADIPAIIDLWMRANEPNQLYRILAPSEEARRKNCTQFLIAMLDDSNTEVMKAVDWKDESIVTAFGVWRKNYPVPEGQREFGGKKMQWWRERGGQVIDGMAMCNKAEEKTPLQKYLAAQQEEIHKIWTKDVNHVELMVLMTDTDYQRRGIGTTLLKWGHEFAAKQNVPEFLDSSPFGFPLYRSLGWNVVAEVKVDLKEWVEGAGEGDMGWGVYKSRSMLRLQRIGDV